MSETKSFKALLLDERDVLRAVVELADESELTERHVDFRPHGGECDRKPGEYRWDREKKQLRPLSRALRAREGKPSHEEAYCFDILGRWEKDAEAVNDVALEWLDEVVLSFDMKGYVIAGHPLVMAYIRSRNLDPKKGA